jgi:hypothetical protein
MRKIGLGPTHSGLASSDSLDQDHIIGIFVVGDSLLQELDVGGKITTKVILETDLREAASIELDDFWDNHQYHVQSKERQQFNVRKTCNVYDAKEHVF